MARRTKPLTNTEVERAKIKATDQKLTDGQGLFLLCNGSTSCNILKT
ncbi:hypothetical protein JFL47_11200 [Haemophilus haemoglobinophilus]|nr:hypothetical protein [Canicola haemoglobinophilus]